MGASSRMDTTDDPSQPLDARHSTDPHDATAHLVFGGGLSGDMTHVDQPQGDAGCSQRHRYAR